MSCEPLGSWLKCWAGTAGCGCSEWSAVTQMGIDGLS